MISGHYMRKIMDDKSMAGGLLMQAMESHKPNRPSAGAIEQSAMRGMEAGFSGKGRQKSENEEAREWNENDHQVNNGAGFAQDDHSRGGSGR
jgi:hypothetical protein